MAKIYSDTQMKQLVIEDEDGKLRVYKGFKLNARTTMVESLKLLKTLLPSIGSIADGLTNTDQYTMPTTLAGAAQLLESNLDEAHLDDLIMKLTGNLLCNGEVIDDWDKHFDQYIYDLPEIIAWTGKENFADFFTKNHLVRSKLRILKEKLNPQVAEMVGKILGDNESKKQDTNVQSGENM